MSFNIMLTAILKAMLAVLICIVGKESSFGKLCRKKSRQTAEAALGGVAAYAGAETGGSDMGHGEMNDKNNSLCGEGKKDTDHFSGNESRSDDITAPSLRPDNIGKGHRLRFIPNRKSAAVIAEFTGKIASNSGIPPKISGRIKIVTCEITSNIINYSGASLAEMSYSMDSDRLEILFVDNGKPFDPLKVEPPDITLPAEERTIGGLGIFLVREMAESVEYKYENNKNILKVTMALN